MKEITLDLTRFRELCSFKSNNISRQEKTSEVRKIGKKQIGREDPDYKKFKKIILEGIQEKQLPVFLLVESLVFIGNLFEDNFKCSDLIHEKLKNTYGEDFWEK